MRVEILEDGYDVSDVPCYGITSNISHAVSCTTRFYAHRQGCSCQVYGQREVSVSDAFVNHSKFDTICSSACEKYDILAKLTGKEVEKSLARTDASNI